MPDDVGSTEPTSSSRASLITDRARRPGESVETCDVGHAAARPVANEPEALKAILAELGDELRVALEPTYGWEWLADMLEAEGHELHLSHPLRTKATVAARVKPDAVDARTLAHLLRTDLLPEAYVAPRELRDLRDLLRQRIVLTRMRSALKNRVHAFARPSGDPDRSRLALRRGRP